MNFITGAGGFLQTVVMGYPGIRVQPSGDLLRLSPRCPEGVTKLKIRGLQYLGNELAVGYACSDGARVPYSVSVAITQATTSARELVVSTSSKSTSALGAAVEDAVVLKQGHVGAFVELPAAGGEVFIKSR